MGNLKQTHTYAVLELSKPTYDEISRKLREADYGHAFVDGGVIDMHGIAVATEVTDVDQAALDATNEVMKRLADMSHAPYAQVKANVQIVVAEALRKCRTS